MSVHQSLITDTRWDQSSKSIADSCHFSAHHKYSVRPNTHVLGKRNISGMSLLPQIHLYFTFLCNRKRYISSSSFTASTCKHCSLQKTNIWITLIDMKRLSAFSRINRSKQRKDAIWTLICIYCVLWGKKTCHRNQGHQRGNDQCYYYWILLLWIILKI